MLSLLVAAALAQSAPEAMDVACMPLQVTQTSPAAEATNVPVDAVLKLVLEGDCGGSTEWTIEVTRASDGEVVASTTWTWGGELPALATFDPPEDLPADTALVLHAVGSNGWYEEVQIPFTTGAGAAQGLSGALAAEVTSATFYRESDSVEVYVAVTPAVDPDGLSLVRLRGEGGGHRLVDAATAAAGDQLLYWSLGGEPDEICVDVSQIDARGVETAPVTACGEVEAVGGPFGGGGRGCGGRNTTLPAEPATTEPAQAALFLGGLVFLARRRSAR